MPVDQQHKEKELLKQVAQGDESAFSRLFYAYHQQLGQHVFRLTESMALAEEIVQDVFLKIWMTRETLMDIQNFRSYLFVVTRNHTLNCLRQIIREKKKHKEWEKETAPVQQTFYSTDISAQWHSLIDQAIAQLPPRQKKVYMLSWIDR